MCVGVFFWYAKESRRLNKIEENLQFFLREIYLFNGAFLEDYDNFIKFLDSKFFNKRHLSKFLVKDDIFTSILNHNGYALLSRAGALEFLNNNINSLNGEKNRFMSEKYKNSSVSIHQNFFCWFMAIAIRFSDSNLLWDFVEIRDLLYEHKLSYFDLFILMTVEAKSRY